MKKFLITLILLQGCTQKTEPKIFGITETVWEQMTHDERQMAIQSYNERMQMIEDETDYNPIENALKIADTDKGYADHITALENPYAIKRIERYSGTIKLNNGEIYKPDNPQEVKNWEIGQEIAVRPQNAYEIILVNLDIKEYTLARKKY